MEILGIKLKYSLRMYVAFEGIAGKSFSLDSYTDIITLIFAAIVTAPAVRSGDKDCPTADEIYNYLDEHQDTIRTFVEWLTSQSRPDDMMSAGDDVDDKKKA